MIAGFSGWGNALDIAKGLMDYLIQKLYAEPIGHINSDMFYNYGDSRPIVHIESGILTRITPPSGRFYLVKNPEGNDLILFRADEPNLRWLFFIEELMSWCDRLHIHTIITLESLYDHVLHTQRKISAMASTKTMIERLKQKHIQLISYEGPSSIHSMIHAECKKMQIQCINLWCHCPYYLEGINHYGLMASLVRLLGELIDFPIHADELENNWQTLLQQINTYIAKNPELMEIIEQLQEHIQSEFKDNQQSPSQKKVIQLKDYMNPK